MLIAYVAAVHPFGGRAQALRVVPRPHTVLDVFWGPRAHNWFMNQSGLRRLLLLSYLGSSGADALVRVRAVAGAMRALSRGARGRSCDAVMVRVVAVVTQRARRSSSAVHAVAALARRGCGALHWFMARAVAVLTHRAVVRVLSRVGCSRALLRFERVSLSLALKVTELFRSSIAARYGVGVQLLSDFRALTPVLSLSAMSTPDRNRAAYGDALQEVFDLVCEWTAEVGDFAARVFAAEARLEAAHAADAGASVGIPAECRVVLSNLRTEFCAFAVEPWLERFPGYVADLAPRLCAYASELQAAERRVAEAGDHEPDPHACLWAFLLALKESHDARRIPDEDYEWFHARARLALSELAVSSALDTGAAGAAPTVIAAAVTQPAPSSHVMAAVLPALPAVPFVALVDPPALALARPVPRIVRPPSVDVAVASSPVAPDVAEGRSSSLKRARSSPDAAWSLEVRARRGFFQVHPLFAIGLRFPSPPSSLSPSPSPVAVSPVQASPVSASPVLSGLDFAEVDRLGAVAFWRGEVAWARAAAKAAQAHLQLAEQSLSLALGELVAPPVQAVPSSSRASSCGRGGVGKGKEKKRK
ncbi:hypothetical protein EDB85DRAFT_2150409 [Lactarius pseudohatsudake]|nr:hypothetical protein EDB85DRAFT_2150409 [Lactarius pseudohatsudake]